MRQPAFYEILVEGQMNSRWCDWFPGLTVSTLPEGRTVISGELTDQAALHGILMKIRDLRLVLISVNQVEPPTNISES